MNCSLPGSSIHGIFKQEYWSGLPFPSPGDPPDPETEPMSTALVGRFFTTEPSGKPEIELIIKKISANKSLEPKSFTGKF